MINKVFNEDCLITMSRIEDKSVNLIIADFPYFEVKGEFDFVWKDFDEFLVWVEVCAKEFKRILADNGSLYVYGHAKKIAYKQIIFDKYFNLENNVVWKIKDKVAENQRFGNEFNSFPPITERILFYSNGGTLEDIENEYIAPRNQFSLYLKGEFLKAKVTNKEISRLFPSKTGGLTGCVSNWLNGLNIITKEQYGSIKKYLGNDYLEEDYEVLKLEYENLRLKYEDLRRPFSNHHNCLDVIETERYEYDTRHINHPTKKNKKLSKILIETSTRENDLVYIPFGGSGTEIEQCHLLNRRYIGSELESKYCDIIEDRIKNAKGEVGLFDENPKQGSLL